MPLGAADVGSGPSVRPIMPLVPEQLAPAPPVAYLRPTDIGVSMPVNRLFPARRSPSAHRRGRGHALGFNLVELAVVVAVLALLAAIGTPRMIALINSNRLAGATGELVAALQLARSEAIRRSARVTVCASANGITCASSTSWTRWIIVGRDNTTGANEVIRDHTITGTIQMRGPRDGIRFNPSGLAAAEQLLSTCVATTRPADNQREVRVLVSGSVISTKRNGGGVCP